MLTHGRESRVRAVRSTSTGTSATAGSGPGARRRRRRTATRADRWSTANCATTTTGSRSRPARPTRRRRRRRCTTGSTTSWSTGGRADAELNYRRFFAVNTLAGIRVEVPGVRRDAREILRWVDEGLVDGLRIDHPDGLRDPARLPRRPRRRSPAAPTCWSRRSSSRGEQLPATGRRPAPPATTRWALVDRVLVDPAGEEPLDDLDARLRGGAGRLADDSCTQKRAVADSILQRRGAPARARARARRRRLDRPRSTTRSPSCWPASRSTAPTCPWGGAPRPRRSTAARAHRPDLPTTLDALRAGAGRPGAPAAPRFQQTTGMVMAKGVEDTAFYRYRG